MTLLLLKTAFMENNTCVWNEKALINLFVVTDLLLLLKESRRIIAGVAETQKRSFFYLFFFNLCTHQVCSAVAMGHLWRHWCAVVLSGR